MQKKPTNQDFVELAKQDAYDNMHGQQEGDNFYSEAEPQFDVMRKITTSENYEAELQRQLERSANWSTAPPTVKKSHKRRHRSSKRESSKQRLDIQVNGEEGNEEDMLSPASGSSESVR